VDAGRRTRSPAGNPPPSDSLFSSRQPATAAATATRGPRLSFPSLPFLTLPASQPPSLPGAPALTRSEFVCASDPSLWRRPHQASKSAPSLSAPVSSSNRRKVASVSQLGLAKKQREQQPPQSTFTSCPNLQHRVDDLAIEVSSFCPRIAQPIASDHLVPEEGCLLARPHCQQPRGAIFRLAHPPTLAPSPPSPSRTSPSSISNCQPHNPPTCRTTSLPTRCRRASSKPVVKPKT
jgi:hypothetical protein